METEILQMSFYDFCNYLEKVVQVDSKEQKCELLGNVLNKVKTQNTDSIFGILRLILPQYDKLRTSYGMKEAVIGKYVAHTFNLSKETDDYKLLYINDYPEIKRSKDYGLVVSKISYKYNNKLSSNLNILQINEHLTNISKQSDLYQNLIKTLSPLENKWLVRIILKNIRLGLMPDSILSIFHSNAVTLFEHNNDLYSIIQNCVQNENTNTDNLNLFQFIRPMLSIKASKKLLSQTTLNNFYVEEKFDGERFQLHLNRNKNECKWYSRNGHTYPFDTLTIEVLSVLKASVNNVILDGEMVGYDLNTKQYGTKGFNYDIKKVKDTSRYQASFIIFDVIYFNNRDLIETPLKLRRDLLEDELIEHETHFIKISNCLNLKNSEDVITHLSRAIDNNLEGIVIKDPSSYYLSNKRTSNWIKIKPEYFEGLITDLDLLIIGGYYGDGRQSGQVATFLLGVLNENRYVSIGQSGLGLTNNELKKLQFKLIQRWQKVRKNEMPNNVKWGKEKPHVWIEPEHSVVLEIKASELQRSDSFITKYTLRFPRIVRVRYDKPINECMTLKEYHDLILNQNDKPVIKLPTRLPTINDLMNTNPEEIKSEPIELKNHILEGRKFYVLSGTDDLTISDVQKLIIENGGSIVVNNCDACILIGGNRNFQVQTEINLHKRDIVKVNWLLNVIQNQQFVDWIPQDAYAVATLERKKKFDFEFDSYSDHYTKHADLNSLVNCLKNIHNTMEID